MTTPITTPFNQLDNHLNQEVTLRGFVYLNNHQQWVLASEPNLKSCCLRSDKQNLILLDRALDQNFSNQAVTIKGVLTTQHSGKYLLQDSTLIIVNQESYSLMFLVVIALIFTTIIVIKRKKSH